MNRKFLLSKLSGLYNGKKQMLVYDQNTGDIIQCILNEHEKYKDQYKKISSYFKGFSVEQTGKNIFDFLKNNIRYIIESEDQQLVKSPAAILHTAKSDCKCYSLFGAGVCRELGIPYCFRFASYRSHDKNPGHVFVVIYPGTDKEIWLDPVLSNYNYKKAYNYKIDKKAKNMAVYSISGIGKVKKKITKFGAKLKKGLKGVIKVAAAPARNAFLALVALNVHGLGTSVMRIYKKAPDKLKNFWGSAGGQINKLVAAAQKGSRKKRILGTDPNPNIIGAAIPALLASAAPFLAKITKVLKELGINPKELVDVAKMAVNKKAQELISTQTEEAEQTEEEYQSEAEADYNN